MGAAYSQDLRDRVLAAYDRGMMTKAISDLFSISPAWARRVKQQRRESGRTAPLPMGGVRIVKVDMTRLRGRAPVGERLLAKVPHGHWQTTTLIAALGIGGIRCSAVIDGAVNAEVFEAFVEQVLVKQLQPGDVVVLDNLSSHKRSRTRQLIQSAGAELLFLPPYSPDFNPIELVFSKLKQLVRSLACRTRDALWQMIQPVLNQITAADASNCFRHCGYTLQMD